MQSGNYERRGEHAQACKHARVQTNKHLYEHRHMHMLARILTHIEQLHAQNITAIYETIIMNLLGNKVVHNGTLVVFTIKVYGESKFFKKNPEAWKLRFTFIQHHQDVMRGFPGKIAYCKRWVG